MEPDTQTDTRLREALIEIKHTAEGYCCVQDSDVNGIIEAIERIADEALVRASVPAVQPPQTPSFCSRHQIREPGCVSCQPKGDS